MRQRQRRNLVYAAVSGLGGILGATIVACSNAPVPAGLEVTIVTDLPAVDDAVVQIEVSQQLSNGSWHKYFSNTWAVPGDISLPSSIAIAAGTSPDQDALVVVTAYSAYDGATQTGTKTVVRSVQLQVPTDRVAALTVTLAASCLNNFCTNMNPAESSCLPTTGACGPNTIDSSQLPTYDGGVSASGAGDASTCGAKCADAATHDSGRGDASSSGSGSDATVGSRLDSGSASGSGTGSLAGSGSMSGTGSSTGPGSFSGSGSSTSDSGTSSSGSGSSDGSGSGWDGGSATGSGSGSGTGSGTGIQPVSDSGLCAGGDPSQPGFVPLCTGAH